MARNAEWHDDYWLLLMQLYLKKPVGVKPVYSRPMVDLSLELHIAPQVLYGRMRQLAYLDTPRLERIRQTYSKNPKRLERAISLLRQMKGFGAEDEFYDGVEMQETFEKDFRPVLPSTTLTPVHLIMVLDLYFRLTPSTMTIDTPEVKELARLLKINPDQVVEVMEVMQHCDPYLDRQDVTFSPLLLPCQQVWQRFGNQDPVQLADYAAQLQDYFK